MLFRSSAATAETIPIDSTHNLVIDTTGDSSGASTTRVSVRDSGTGAQIGSTVTLSGIPSGSTFTADRDRVMVTTAVDFPVTPYNVQVAVIDTGTGTQVGTTLVLAGRGTGQLVVGDDNRVLFTTEVYAVSGDSTHVSLIDSANGTQIGTTLVLDGRSPQGPVLDATRDRAVITTSSDSTTGYHSQVAVFDTHTGTQAGTTLNFTGSPAVQLVGTDGLALISSYRYDSATGGATDFTILDTSTGAKVGSGLTLEGGRSNTSPVSVDGTHLLVIAVNQDLYYGSATTHAAVLDTANGTQVGHTLTLDGAPWGNPIVNDDGVHVVLTASISGATHVAVMDGTTGEQSGDTIDLEGAAGSVLPAAGGVHVLITADDGLSTHIAVIDATTGEQTGTTLALTGRIGTPLISADGIHALLAASADNATQIAVVDTTTGKQTGTTLTLAGRVTVPLVNADGIHALFVASAGNATQIVVVDTATGEQTGAGVDVDGAMGFILGDAGLTHALITTTDGASTHVVSVNSATGQLTGAPLTFTGQIPTWPSASTAADGTHALFVLDDADETRLVLIDITTGTQTGTGLTLPGDPGLPIVSDEGNHTTIVTRVAATAAHGSSTRIAVIDNTTGNQVGVTTRLTGTPAGLPQLSAGNHVVVTTFAGLSADLNTTTGTATTRVAGFPWGLDLEAFAITPLGQLVIAIQSVVFTAQAAIVALVIFGPFWLASIFGQLHTSQAAPAAQFSYYRPYA